MPNFVSGKFLASCGIKKRRCFKAIAHWVQAMPYHT